MKVISNDSDRIRNILAFFSKLTIVLFFHIFFWGCDSSSKSGTGNTEKNERVEDVVNEDSPVILVADQKIIRLIKVGYGSPIELDAEYRSLAYHNNLYWVNTASNTIYAYAENKYDMSKAAEDANYDANYEELKIEKQFKHNYENGKILFVDNRLFMLAKDPQENGLSLVEFDVESGQELKKIKFSDEANNYVNRNRIFQHNNHIYYLSTNAFAVFRININSLDVKKLDLRESSVGKAANGDMAMAGGKLWVLDSKQKTFIKINPDNLTIESSLTFEEAGINVEIDFCEAGKEYLYCWADRDILALNIATGKVSSTFQDVVTFRQLTAQGNSLYASKTGGVYILDENTLEEKKILGNFKVEDFIVKGR
ncbi:MAG: hypothetical protein ACFCUU_07185 [Cyclobacteriaceae bacterium]